MDKLTQSIFNYIEDQGRPIKSKNIEQKFYISGEELRGLINSMRRQGVPVGSGPSGYYVCRSESQFDATINNLENRIQSMEQAMNGLRIAKNAIMGGIS